MPFLFHNFGTETIRIDAIKATDLWWELCEQLGLDEDAYYRNFEYGDYAEIEIEVDETLKILGGRFIPFRK